jgi:outer membrane protein
MQYKELAERFTPVHSEVNMMRVLSIALGLILAGNAMAESKGLSDIYSLAVANDPSLRAQAAIKDSSVFRAEQISAGDGLSIDASTSVKRTENFKTSDGYKTGSATVTVKMPLIDRGLEAQIKGEDASARRAAANFDSYKQTYIVKVAELYFRVLSAQQDLSAANAEVQAFERQLEQAQERLAVGIGTRVDVDQARARFDLAQVGLISDDVALETARSDLQQLINTAVPKLADLSSNYSVDAHRSLSEDLQIFVDKHPKVVGQEEAYQSELANLEQARSETSAEVHLSSIFSLSDTAGSKTASTNASSRNNVLAFTLSMPLYNNRASDAKVAVAQADVYRSQADLERVKREVSSGMRVAYRNLEASLRTVEARRLAIVSAASRVEATEAAYAVGSGDIVEVLNAKKDLFAAERDFAKARYTHVIRQLEFDQAIGDLSESAVARIDQYLGQ